MRKLLWAPVWLLVLLYSAWAAAAIGIDGPLEGGAAKALAGTWAAALLVVLWAFRPAARALGLVAVLNIAATLWWLGIDPSNDRDWIPDVARLPRVEMDGDRIRIHNVRDFEYRSETDYTPRWETRSYDLSEVRALDLFISRWGAPLIAHTIMSWEFADGRHLAASIETRKEVGEEYSALLGFFRQFELYYVLADERDVIALRTNHRSETVSLYRLSATPERARAMLEDYIRSINGLVETPDWYNALTHNCTVTIWRHAHHLDRNVTWDWRFLVNGSADAMLYSRGAIDTSIPFDELQRRSNITDAARAAGDGPDFSTRIRRGLPRMSEPPRANAGRTCNPRRLS